MRHGIGFAAAIALAALLTPDLARAGIDACGDIYISAEAECEVVPPGVECESRCTPVTVEAACAADLRAECSGQCTGSASASCTADCQGACEADCTADPGSFSCRGACQADCEGGCEARCATNDSECWAGSCTAEANLDCQLECQSSGYAECTTDVQGGCQSDCTSMQGALFCDGDYIDHESSLEACVTALRERLDIQVDGYAAGECSGNMCAGEAGGSVSCAVAPGARRGGAGLLVLLGLALAVRRRRR